MNMAGGLPEYEKVEMKSTQRRKVGTCLKLEKNNSGTVEVRVMKFGQNMDEDDPNVDFEGLGHSQKSMSPGQKCNSGLTGIIQGHKVKGHMGQGQRSMGLSPA